MKIVLEGRDGGGKTLITNQLVKILSKPENMEKYGIEEVMTTREPGGTPMGEELRALLKNGNIPRTVAAELLMFMAVRHDSYPEQSRFCTPNTKNILISDRGLPSSFVYQACEDSAAMVLWNSMYRNLIQPGTYHFLIECPYSEYVSRRGIQIGDNFEEGMTEERYEELGKRYREAPINYTERYTSASGVTPREIAMDIIKKVINR